MSGYQRPLQTMPMAQWRQWIEKHWHSIITQVALKIGIKVPSPEGVLHVNDTSTSFPRGIILEQSTADTGGGVIAIRKTRGTSAGSHTVVQAGDTVGYFAFVASDGDSFENVAYISAAIDGTPGDGDMPGSMSFFTTPDGSAAATEKFTIDNAGIISISVDPPDYANNAAAKTGGLVDGNIYRNGDVLMIVHS